jgi:DNA-directed RNA polymerase subunit RPC12/RpoP
MGSIGRNPAHRKNRRKGTMIKLPEEIESPMVRTLNRNLLKWAAGRAIFCPRCGDVMDCRRTMVIGTDSPEGQHEEHVRCVDCGDKILAMIGQTDFTLGDVVDGRIVFARAKRSRKVA